jgi:hypothetical protein
MFKKMGKYLESKYTDQLEEPDDNDFQEEFEPMDVQKLPHLYTVSDTKIEAVMRELKDCNGVYAAGMLRTLGILELPS